MVKKINPDLSAKHGTLFTCLPAECPITANIVKGESRDKFIWLCRAASYIRQSQISERREQRQIYLAMPSRILYSALANVFFTTLT